MHDGERLDGRWVAARSFGGAYQRSMSGGATLAVIFIDSRVVSHALGLLMQSHIKSLARHLRDQSESWVHNLLCQDLHTSPLVSVFQSSTGCLGFIDELITQFLLTLLVELKSSSGGTSRSLPTNPDRAVITEQYL